MTTILVTGGAGFIGANFVYYMAEQYPNYKIMVVDKLTYAGDKARLEQLGERVSFVETDICDEQKMDEVLNGVDWVVHFAAETHVDRSIAEPGPFLRSNILGTETLVRLALKYKVKRFHHVSTDEVFGSLSLDSPEKFNELTPYDPRSPYAASKAASDHIVRAYGETYGLPYTITNCSNNYGAYDSPGRVIPLFIANALQDKPLPVYGNGSAVRDYLFVTDHCRAIDLVLHKGTIGKTYCVGGATQKNGIEVAEAILKILNKPAGLLQFVEDRPGHDMRYEIDSSYIKDELGWQPSVSFEEGLAETIEWYKTHQDWWTPFAERMTLLRESTNYRGNA
ncbi:dTDP-glucose 4,6-dehydratase [Candidatus Saccharibacteria bacterium]|nr:MAG: dTDP-glucose 4,6-dehydratase [Candidatus Saccharibacteria bacterium]